MESSVLQLEIWDEKSKPSSLSWYIALQTLLTAQALKSSVLQLEIWDETSKPSSLSCSVALDSL